MQSMLDKGEAGTVDMIFVDVGERARYASCHELAMQVRTFHEPSMNLPRARHAGAG